MSPSKISNHFTEAAAILEQFSTEDNFSRIAAAGDLMVNCIQHGGKILSCGNGGSMCDAMHFAEELSGRYRDNRPPIAAISLSDASHMSCVGNDYGFEQIFSRFIQAIGQKEDILLAISTSGNSENVIRAIHAAKEKGMKTIALTGKSGGKIAEMVDIEIRAPYSEFADRAQEIHIKVIHSLIDHIESNL